MRSRSTSLVVWLTVGLSSFGLSSCDGELFEMSHSAVDEGNAAWAEGKVAEALAAYEAAAAEIPESPELSYDRGVALSGVGRFGDATQMLLRALESRDGGLRFKVYAALGAAYAGWGQEIERGALPGAPEPGDTAEPEGEDEGSEQAADPMVKALPKWKRAVEHLEKALLLQPDDEGVLRNLEVALLRVDPPCSRRDDELEPNGSPELASPIVVEAEAPAPQSGGPQVADPTAQDELRWKRQLMACPDDTDWLKIELGAGDRLAVKLTQPKETGRLGVTLLAPGDGRQLRPPEGSDVVLDGFEMTVGSDGDGTYLIRVDNLDGDEVSYGLEVTVRPPCGATEDQFEDNDEAAQAKVLTPGSLDGLRLCPLDEDWYAFPLAEGESLFVFAQLSGDEDKEEEEGDAKEGPPPISLELIGPDGVRHTGAPAGQGRVATLLTPGPGEYLLRVWGTPELEARYQLVLNVVPPCPEGDDELEDNDGPEDAAVFPPAPAEGAGGPAEGGGPPPPMLLRICPGDEDWMAVTAEPEKPAMLSAVFEHAKGDLEMTLFDEAGGEELQQSDGSSAEQNGEGVALPPVEEPTVFKVRVRGKEGAENFYLLKLDQPQGGDSSDKPQDDEEKEDEEKKDEDEQEEEKKDEPKDESEEQEPKKPEPQEAKPEPTPLEDALDKLDRNPQNLEAQERAQRSPLANHPPEKDW